MKEPFCKNCLLYDKPNQRCKVIILHEGEKYNLPVDDDDPCFFENKFIAINDEGSKESFKVGVEQVRFWVEDKQGKPIDGEGVVKIEYPEGFFGKEET